VFISLLYFHDTGFRDCRKIPTSISRMLSCRTKAKDGYHVTRLILFINTAAEIFMYSPVPLRRFESIYANNIVLPKYHFTKNKVSCLGYPRSVPKQVRSLPDGVRKASIRGKMRPGIGNIGLIKTIFRLYPSITDQIETISVISYFVCVFNPSRKKLSHYRIYRLIGYRLGRTGLYKNVYNLMA
jgi:hypothetical protein